MSEVRVTDGVRVTRTDPIPPMGPIELVEVTATTGARPSLRFVKERPETRENVWFGIQLGHDHFSISRNDARAFFEAGLAFVNQEP